MAISFVNSTNTGTTGQTSATSVTLTYPTGVAANDVILIVHCSRDSTTATATGFTTYGANTSTSSSSVIVLYKVAAGTESGTFTLTQAGNSYYTTVYLIRGVDVSGTLMESPATNNGAVAGGSATTLPTITMSAAGRYIAACSTGVGTASVFTFASPLTEQTDAGNGGTATKGQGHGLGYQDVSSGSTGTKSVTATTAGGYVAFGLRALVTSSTPTIFIPWVCEPF